MWKNIEAAPADAILGLKQSSRKFLCSSRSFRYSGKYLPACLMNQIDVLFTLFPYTKTDIYIGCCCCCIYNNVDKLY